MKNIPFILLLLITLSACGEEGEQTQQKRESFYSFFQKFKSDPVFQKERIVFPITISSWEGDMGEEQTRVEENCTESKWRFDDFSILAEKNSLMEVVKESKGYKKIVVGYKNSDVLSHYIFKKIGGQWYLTQIDN